MADTSPHGFLLFLVSSLAGQPDAISIKESEDDQGRTLFQVSVDPSDRAAISEGDLADALHTAFSAFTYKHRIRASLELRG
jgi:predicted RNA-binding protein YlqC (UPF0109 family)